MAASAALVTGQPFRLICPAVHSIYAQGTCGHIYTVLRLISCLNACSARNYHHEPN